jgi:16S rRNA (cytidine1402-2'-O)-methyltransferase
MSGILFLVSIPIGNEDDITFRALNVLRETDIIVYEERRVGNKFLSKNEIHAKRTESLNEHDEAENSDAILSNLLEGKNVALISDAGTPVFSDPGKLLVKKAIEHGINTIPIPGASSIVPALVLSGFFIDEFVFCGFLSPKTDKRRAELMQLRNEQRVMVLMDTPYRLAGLVSDISSVFGHERQIAIAYNLTMPDEQVLRGWPDELYQTITRTGMKGEFVLIIDCRRGIPSDKNTGKEETKY